jgi:hypothetical protein
MQKIIDKIGNTGLEDGRCMENEQYNGLFGLEGRPEL